MCFQYLKGHFIHFTQIYIKEMVRPDKPLGGLGWVKTELTICGSKGPEMDYIEKAVELLKRKMIGAESELISMFFMMIGVNVLRRIL